MSSTSTAALEQLCDEWLNIATELVDWFEPRSQLSPLERATRSDELMGELAEHSRNCHAFRDTSNRLIALLVSGSRDPGIKLQPIVDFLKELDDRFDNLPTRLEDLKPLWGLRHEASSTVRALKAAYTPPSQAEPANVGGNPPIRCTQADVLRADALEPRAGYLDELEAKGEIKIIERAKGHKQPHLIQFTDRKRRDKVECSIQDYRRDGSKNAHKTTKS